MQQMQLSFHVFRSRREKLPMLKDKPAMIRSWINLLSHVAKAVDGIVYGSTTTYASLPLGPHAHLHRMDYPIMSLTPLLHHHILLPSS